ncbi:hypothetical protein ABZY10_06000 [Streptomyces sp. NPDC006539]|uniref:hypothetical protein n=1 Tax=unclassified Streptomyces TaxID=2593676 RepID=UPI0033ADCAA1
MASLTRNQWIAVAVPLVVALIGAIALFLSSSDGSGTENHCTEKAQCAGNNINNTEN